LILVDTSVWIDHLRGSVTKQTTLFEETRAATVAAYVRTLRSKGITIRKTVDILIATWCIEHGVPLLHADADFAHFKRHCGLLAA
jgi:predicted nucleic acid-binding protein